MTVSFFLLFFFEVTITEITKKTIRVSYKIKKKINATVPPKAFHGGSMELKFNNVIPMTNRYNE